MPQPSVPAAAALTRFLSTLTSTRDLDVMATAVLHAPVGIVEPVAVAVYVAAADQLVCVASSGFRAQEAPEGITVPMCSADPVAEAFVGGRIITVSFEQMSSAEGIGEPSARVWRALSARGGRLEVTHAPIVHGGAAHGLVQVFAAGRMRGDADAAALLDGTTSAVGLWLVGRAPADGGPAAAVGVGSRPALTPRQERVLELLAAGTTTVRMAAVLNYAPSTVEKEVHRVMAALGASDRETAVALARGAGLLADRRASGARSAQTSGGE